MEVIEDTDINSSLLPEIKVEISPLKKESEVVEDSTSLARPGMRSWDELREQSLRPEGFGEERIELW